MTGVAIGVDIGGTNLRVASAPLRWVRESSAVPEMTMIEMPVPRTYDRLVEVVVEAARHVAKSNPISGLGVGLPGAVSDLTADFIPALPFLDGRWFGSDVAVGIGAPVRMRNDCQCALLAEHRWGAASSTDSAIMIVIGTGIGGAIVLDGQLLSGSRGTAGAFGWLPIGDVVRSRHGQFELSASGTALAARAAAAGFEVNELAKRARSGDAIAREVIESYSRVLARGIAALASICDPEMVLIGGVISRDWDVYEPAVVAEVPLWSSPVTANVAITTAKLGPSAGVMGALRVGADALPVRTT